MSTTGLAQHNCILSVLLQLNSELSLTVGTVCLGTAPWTHRALPWILPVLGGIRHQGNLSSADDTIEIYTRIRKLDCWDISDGYFLERYKAAVQISLVSCSSIPQYMFKHKATILCGKKRFSGLYEDFQHFVLSIFTSYHHPPPQHLVRYCINTGPMGLCLYRINPRAAASDLSTIGPIDQTLSIWWSLQMVWLKP